MSQQVISSRLDGQVSAQVNMLSDAVKGIRRRPGMRLLADSLFSSIADRSQVFAMTVDINDQYVHVFVDTSTGLLSLFDADWNPLSSSTQTYLIASSASSIQTATLRGYLYLCNTEQTVIKTVDNAGRQDPAVTGFFFIKTGVASKIYHLSVVLDGTMRTVSYTAPNGQTAGDADKTTPDYIMTQLVTALQALALPITLVQSGAYLYISYIGGSKLTVSSDSGSTYVGSSNAMRVATVDGLPASLPPEADGILTQVGTDPKTGVWYQFNYDDGAWNEAGDYLSASSLTNMPLRITLDNTYAVTQPVNEGRLSGNDDSNEDPPFIEGGITGFGAFQGRLVILSGPNVCLSASGKPLRWWRSTVTSLLIADPIAIYSGAASTTDYTQCAQFNKDLLLFSRSVQAVVPSSSSVISPSTAQIVITSSYATTPLAPPVVAGRSLLYYAPRSENYAGVLELVPSTTTDSQYTTNDITAHIPTYIPGEVEQAASSTTSNSVVFLCSGDYKTLFVQQYLWQADNKVQSAWHSWTSPYEIARVWFVRDAVYVALVVNNLLHVVAVEPQELRTVGTLTRPFSDVYPTEGLSVTDRTFTVPTYLRQAILDGADLMVTFGDGDLAGDEIGVANLNTTNWQCTLVRSAADGIYMPGLRYTSTLSPTPPLMKDQNGQVIGTSAALLVRWELTVQDTGTFHAVVTSPQATVTDTDFSGLLWSSNDLLPNTPQIAGTSKVLIPVRVNSNESTTTFTADGSYDMNITDLEYVLQYHQRRRRV